MQYSTEWMIYGVTHLLMHNQTAADWRTL